MILHRYMSFDNSRKESVLKDQLFFSTPEKFNDIFEHYVYQYDFSNVTKDIVNLYLEKNPDEKKSFDTLGYDNFVMALRNPVNSAFIESFREYGICCFSASYSDIKMWSHYGDMHRGMCVAYEVKDELIGGLVHKMNYGDFERIDYWKSYFSNFEGLVKKVVTKKPIDFGDEQEYRIIVLGLDGLVPLSNFGNPGDISLRGIYFGVQVNSQEARDFMSEVLERNQNIEFMKAEMNPEAFGLTFHQPI